MGSYNKISARVLRATSIFSGVQSVGILCAMVRTKCIALWIGEVGVGLFAIYNSVIDLVSTGTQLSIRNSSVRDLSAASHSGVHRIARVVRWWGVRLGLAGSLLMLAASPIASTVSFGDPGLWWAFALLSLSVLALAYIASESAILQGTGHLASLAKGSVAGAVTGTAISLPLYYWLGTASIVPSLLVYAAATSLGILCCSRRHNTGRGSVAALTGRACYREGLGFIRLGVYMTISSVATALASYVFLSYLNMSASTAEVGLYQSGYTLLVKYTGIVLSAMGMEYFPRLAQVAHRPRMASTVVSHETLIILYILTPLLVLFVAFDQVAVWLLYTEEFTAMLPFVTVGIGGMVFRAVSFCMAFTIISRGDGRTYVLTEVLSNTIGLTLNIVCFHHWSFVGLGISYVVWYALYTAIIGCVYARYGMRLSAPALRLAAVSLALVGAAIAVKPCGWLAETPLIAASGLLAYHGYRKIIRNRTR